MSITTLIAALSNLNFVGHFNVPRNDSTPYGCICGFNVSKGSDFNDTKLLEIIITDDSGVQVYHFNSTTFQKPAADISTRHPKAFDDMLTSDIFNISTEPMQLLNFSVIENTLSYKCKDNAIYKYLYAFVGVLTFLFGLYLQPDLILESLKKVREQHLEYGRTSSYPNAT